MSILLSIINILNKYTMLLYLATEYDLFCCMNLWRDCWACKWWKQCKKQVPLNRLNVWLYVFLGRGEEVGVIFYFMDAIKKRSCKWSWTVVNVIFLLVNFTKEFCKLTVSFKFCRITSVMLICVAFNVWWSMKTAS